MSAGLPLPKQIFGHGWWMRDDAKMSKSLGNVVRPDALLERFGADPLRYFLAREMSFGQDASFSDQAFIERFNSDLANALGNTASRTLSMAGRYLDSKAPAPTSEGPVPEAAATAVEKTIALMDERKPQRALEATWQLLTVINQYIQESQPWTLAKKGEEGMALLKTVLYTCLEGLRIASLLIEPVMPETAAKLRTQLGAADLPVDLTSATSWGLLPEGAQIPKTEALFPRVDIKKFLKEIEETEAAPAAEVEEKTDDTIEFEDFMKVKLKVGIVKEAVRVPKSKKLIKMQVDLDEAELRQIVAGIGVEYQPEDLVGRRIVVVANLKPAKLMGVESRGMLLAASIDGAPILLAPDGEVPPGTGVR